MHADALVRAGVVRTHVVVVAVERVEAAAIDVRVGAARLAAHVLRAAVAVVAVEVALATAGDRAVVALAVQAGVFGAGVAIVALGVRIAASVRHEQIEAVAALADVERAGEVVVAFDVRRATIAPHLDEMIAVAHGHADGPAAGAAAAATGRAATVVLRAVEPVVAVVVGVAAARADLEGVLAHAGAPADVDGAGVAVVAVRGLHAAACDGLALVAVAVEADGREAGEGVDAVLLALAGQAVFVDARVVDAPILGRRIIVVAVHGARAAQHAGRRGVARLVATELRELVAGLDGAGVVVVAHIAVGHTTAAGLLARAGVHTTALSAGVRRAGVAVVAVVVRVAALVAEALVATGVVLAGVDGAGVAVVAVGVRRAAAGQPLELAAVVGAAIDGAGVVVDAVVVLVAAAGDGGEDALMSFTGVRRAGVAVVALAVLSAGPAFWGVRRAGRVGLAGAGRLDAASRVAVVAIAERGAVAVDDTLHGPGAVPVGQGRADIRVFAGRGGDAEAVDAGFAGAALEDALAGPFALAAAAAGDE